MLLRVKQRHRRIHDDLDQARALQTPSRAASAASSSAAFVTRTASQPMPSASLTKSIPGNSSPGTFRTCITWLNERIAP